MPAPYSTVTAPYPDSSLRVFANSIYRSMVLTADWSDLADVCRYIQANAFVAAYILVGSSDGKVCCRIGEGAKLHQRPLVHRHNPKLSFAQKIFVLTSGAFDKASVIYLQERLTRLAQQAERSEVVMGVGPITGFPLLPGNREALDLVLQAALVTLADAGCSVLQPCSPGRETAGSFRSASR